MKNVFFAQPDQVALARSMETKLLSLPKESGILFASVEVVPEDTNASNQHWGLEIAARYQIAVGCSREADPGWIDPLVRATLATEIQDGCKVEVDFYRGISRG
jgi:hypothetical protein